MVDVILEVMKSEDAWFLGIHLDMWWWSSMDSSKESKIETFQELKIS